MAGENNTYRSKYFTAEEIDQRLLQGYYDDAVDKGYTGTKEDFLSDLLTSLANYHNISGATHIGEFNTIQEVWEACKQIALNKPEISIIKYSVKQGITYNSGVVFQSFNYNDHIVTQYYFYGGGQKHECNVRHIVTDGTEDTWQPLHIYTSFSFEKGSLYGYKYGKSESEQNKVKIIKIPNASLKSPGLLSTDDKSKLDSLAEIGESYDLNTYMTSGVYLIHTTSNEAKNYPIQTPANSVLRLTVMDSYDGNNQVITQVLNINNNVGGECGIYTRSNQNQTWKPWATLQTNINVDTVDNLDSFKDNGIYSGVWTKGSYNTYPLTFVCIVINDYFVGAAPRRISQFVYGLSKFDGSTVYQSRVWDDSKNAWGDWEILNQKEISSMISNEIKKVTDGVDPEKLDSLKDLIAWADTHGGEVAGIKSDIQANEAAIEMEAERAIEAERKLEEKIAKEKTALVNGDTIVGLARDVYSRQGKADTATFLKRTTAGGTSVSDGVATLKQIGGNIVKNLGDITTALNYGSVTVVGNIAKLIGVEGIYGEMKQFVNITDGHKYYSSAKILMMKGENCQISINEGYNSVYLREIGKWSLLSVLGEGETGKSPIIRVAGNGEVCIMGWLLIDLTEMFGAGNEPTKEECDRMFACVGALPQGLTVAQPTGLKSIGYNQWNPDNVLINKTITDNAIVDGDRNIAVIECLPCKTGTGENNGYVIGYGEGDTWSDEGIEVYLTPLNPMEVDGELYLQKLDKDATYGTYVPQIKGYLLVVTPTTDKLCAHFHWSGDREFTDYEEYVESNVALPVIPEMSEWGLAGLCSEVGATKAVYDTIDLENSRYTRRIGSCKVNELEWSLGKATANEIQYCYFFTPNMFMHINSKCMLQGYTKVKDEPVAIKELANLTFMAYSTGKIYLRNTAFSTIDEFLASEGEKRVFYELITTEEYPIVTKAAPNYISSDYGVEEFTGSKVPLVANILFYMRSLVSETRNFLDRLMARLGTSDATAVADKIADVILPQDTPTEETDVEPTEVIEE